MLSFLCRVKRRYKNEEPGRHEKNRQTGSKIVYYILNYYLLQGRASVSFSHLRPYYEIKNIIKPKSL